MRALVLLALVVAAPAVAQGTKAPATKQAPATQSPAVPAPATKAPATKAPATKAPATKAPATAATKQPATTQPATAQKGAAAQQSKGGATGGATKAPGGTPALAVAPEVPAAPRIPVIMREVFDYDIGGRRDPFVSLLTTADLRPTIADLRLVIVLYDESGRRPVAVMRDVGNNTQYRVTTGMTLGRMRVAAIKRRSVIFTIEEFGLNRQDSLVLGDTTKVRAR